MSRAIYRVIYIASLALAACTAHPSPATTPPEAPSRAPVAVAEAGSQFDPLGAFAAARGGLHGKAARIRSGVIARLKGVDSFEQVESQLFFVGGDAAHAAWIATPWNPTWGAAPKELPFSHGPSICENGFVFELVDRWPRAVRVSRVQEVNGVNDGTLVALETLAVRDQQGGDFGSVIVTRGSNGPEASPAWTYHPEIITSGARPTDVASREPVRIVDGGKGTAGADAASKTVKAAAVSLAGLAGMVAPDGADVVELWQDVFVRKVAHVAPNDVAGLQRVGRTLDAARAAATTECDFVGLCTQSEWRGPISGLALVPGSARASGSRPRTESFRIGAIFVAPLVVRTPEPLPSPTSPEDALVALRMNAIPEGGVNVLASVAIGSNRLLAVEDAGSRLYVVERDGPFSRVTVVGGHHFESTTTEARVDDVDDDGVADIAYFARSLPAETTSAGIHSKSEVVVRTGSIAIELKRDKLGIEIDLVGAGNLDEAIRRAHARVRGAVVTPREACALLAVSGTPSGLARNAASGARIVYFDEPMEPAEASRAIPVLGAAATDAATVHDGCAHEKDLGPFVCRRGLCGNLDSPLGNIFRFASEGGVLKLERALIYEGS